MTILTATLMSRVGVIAEVHSDSDSTQEHAKNEKWEGGLMHWTASIAVQRLRQVSREDGNRGARLPRAQQTRTWPRAERPYLARLGRFSCSRRLVGSAYDRGGARLHECAAA